jgi:hypothetical protein
MPYLKLEIERKLPEQLFQILASIGYWNQNGFQIWMDNKAGKLGSKESQQFAKKVPQDSFVLDCLYSDINCFANGNGKYWVEGYKFGKGGSHIWVSDENNERVLFIHY